jgi:hypothetical protein
MPLSLTVPTAVLPKVEVVGFVVTTAVALEVAGLAAPPALLAVSATLSVCPTSAATGT